MTSRGGALRKKREVIAWFLFFVSRSGGGTRGGMSDEQRQRMHQTTPLVFEAPPALTIAETDSSVAVRSDTGAALVLYNDGRKVTQKVEGGGDIEIKGRWQGNDFVVERKVSGGGKVTEDYLRPQDGKQLYVIVKFEGRTRPLDRVPACVRRRRSDVALWHPRKQSAPDLLESGAHHVSLRTAPAVSAP